MTHRWEPGELGAQVAAGIVERWREIFDETSEEGLRRTTEWFRSSFLPEFVAEVERALVVRFQEEGDDRPQGDRGDPAA